MEEMNKELHYAQNIAKRRKFERNLFIGLFAGMTVLLIIATTALGLACKNGRQTLSFYLKPDNTAVWGNTTIWEHIYDNNPNTIALSFSSTKPTSPDTFKWDGSYPKGYFN